MSKVINVQSAEEFNDILDSNSDVVVDFSAPSWCVPCQRLEPHFNKASEEVDNVTFVMVDVDELPELTNEWGIMSVPTVIRVTEGNRAAVKGRTVIQLLNELRG